MNIYMSNIYILFVNFALIFLLNLFISNGLCFFWFVYLIFFNLIDNSLTLRKILILSVGKIFFFFFSPSSLENPILLQ